MEINKQIQEARDGAEQIQINEVVINQGVSEERVRTVFGEMIPQALEAYTKEAYEIANQRIVKFEENVMKRIREVQEMLPAFTDPSFQLLLRKAQQAAAATERENDYSILTELLVCHVQKGNDRKNKAGIRKAVEIVDEIDNDALCALTVVHAVSSFSPLAHDIKTGLKVLADFFDKLEYENLPNGNKWLDHLDILGAIRLSQFGSMKKFVEYYPMRLEGYACIGIKRESDKYKQALEILDSVGIDHCFLLPNDCQEGYVRLPVVNKESIKNKL